MICPFCAEDLDNYTDNVLKSRISELQAQLAKSENEKNLIFDGIGNLLQRLEKEETLRREKNTRISQLEKIITELEKENRELRSLVRVYDIRVTELSYFTQRHER